MNNITVKSIDVNAIKKMLRQADSNKTLNKQALNLIIRLEEALKRQQELTAYAISKLRNHNTNDGD